MEYYEKAQDAKIEFKFYTCSWHSAQNKTSSNLIIDYASVFILDTCTSMLEKEQRVASYCILESKIDYNVFFLYILNYNTVYSVVLLYFFTCAPILDLLELRYRQEFFSITDWNHPAKNRVSLLMR